MDAQMKRFFSLLLALCVLLTVTAVGLPVAEAATDATVLSVSVPESITAASIEEQQLSGQVSVLLDNGDEIIMAVIWSVPDYLGLPGVYPAEGTLLPVDGVIVPEDLSLSTDVIVPSPKAPAYIPRENEVPMELGESFVPNNSSGLEAGDFEDLFWYSSNSDVAIVDQTGRITAVGYGDAIVGLMTKDGMHIIVFEIKILAPPVTEEPPVFGGHAGAFSDLDPNAWYYWDIDFVLADDIMRGISDTQFAPNMNLSRAMLVQILYNIEGQPAHSGSSSFSDVNEGQWFYDAVTWAAENGIVNGYGDGCFGPDDKITREQLVTIFWRYVGAPEQEGAEVDFLDAAEIDAYAVKAVVWAKENGIFNGVGDGLFDPNGFATRAQAAKASANCIGYIG